MKIGPFIVGNPKAWGVSGALTAIGVGVLGPVGALVAIPVLIAGGFVTASGGNAMYQLPPPK
jgi:hypothetical protein